jgi:hypothetical protein
LSVDETPDDLAESLHPLWLGAGAMVKLVRTTQPFETGMKTAYQSLHPCA